MRLFASKWIPLVLVTAFGLPSAAQVAERTRVLAFGDRPVTERLLPDDQVVVVVRDDSDRSVTEREPTPSEILKALLDSEFGNLVIVDVTRSTGTFVDEGRWIDTQFEGVVTDILALHAAGPPKQLSKGAPISFSFDGGELKVGKVVVRTHNAIHFPVKRRYLVFLGPPVRWGTGSPVAGAEPLLVEGDRLKGAGKTHPPIATLRLRDVAAIARQRR